MLQAWYRPYQLVFKNAVLTSRGQMQVKNGYYLYLHNGIHTGIGECSFIEGLSADNLATYQDTLAQLCRYIETGDDEPDLSAHPSIYFGYETALVDLHAGGNKVLFNSPFTAGTEGIPINGLIWMGTREFMQAQVQEKLAAGFKCIKIKVGAIDFEDEVDLIAFIRSKFPQDVIEIRLDANGAFGSNAEQRLERLSKFHIHSIEQPVKPGQWQLMQQLCKNAAIPIALDEELIGINTHQQMQEVLQTLKPQYLILKPSLLGGFDTCFNWIVEAEKSGIQWWATSALESNIGLNAIAQWCYMTGNPLVQGLGTGALYQNNIGSPLTIRHGKLYYDNDKRWELPQ